MTSFRNRLLLKLIKYNARLSNADITDIRLQRKKVEFWSRFIPNPFSVNYSAFHIDSVSCEWVHPKGTPQTHVMLYLHGGGYAICSPNSHRRLLSKICKHGNFSGLAIDYRLAPESPFPAALDDSVKAFLWLRKNGFKASDIILAGDSAGGGLCIATALKLKEMQEEMPAALVCLSPWLNLIKETRSLHNIPSNETVLNDQNLNTWAKMYAGKQDLSNPLISPIFADLKGLPPTLIQVSSSEVLREDSEQFFENAKKLGVKVELEHWEDMVHVWQMYDYIIPEGAKALKRIAEYSRTQFDMD